MNASSTITTTADTVITIPLRRTKPQEEGHYLFFLFVTPAEASNSCLLLCLAEIKETTKDNAAAATPATIQRRRRPKRRSTGVVQIDMEVQPSWEKPKKKCVVLLPYYYYYYNGIHTGPITFLLLRQSSNQPEKQQTFLSLFFF